MIRGAILAISVMAVTVVWTESFVGSQVVSFENARVSAGDLPTS